MKWSRWEKFIRMCADPVRAKDFLKALDKTDGRQLNGLSAESARILTAVLGASRALGGLLTANPALLSIFESDHLAFPRRKEGLQREAGEAFKNPLLHGQYSAALAELRRVKQREMLRIAARDLGGLSDVVGITRELSDLADTCLEAVLQICRHELVAQCGAPFHQDAAGKWQPSAFCALALGKLGGRELNYSSDVDLLFLYDQDGETFREPPRKNKPARGRMPNARFFSKLAEQFVAEISRTTPEGILYRVDLRLRPDGQTGAIVRSLEAYENYYSEWGRTWERMMLIKARHAAGDRALADEFLEMIQPFRYPRAISPDIFQEISATRERIEKEIVGGRELERNVKLGRGGIREIEFIVQSLQVLHAGNSPFLQLPQTLGAIAKLAEYHLLRREAADGLDAAYRFLRNVEHRLQMEDNLQTHTVPERGPSLLRLAGTMGFASAKKFTAALRAHGKIVRQEYDKLIGPARTKEADLFPPDFAGMEDRWMALLGAHSFRDPEAAAGLFKEFAEGPGYVHVGLRTTALARKLIARFLAFCPVVENGGAGRRPPVKRILSDPDRVLVRLDRFVAAYGAPAALMEFWNHNPAAFELMLFLFDRSDFLAETAIRSPELVEDLIEGERLRQRKPALEILRELRVGVSEPDAYRWFRRYHRAELMRIGMRDILGFADYGRNLAELSALADGLLQFALETVMRRNNVRSPPFAIIGLGKLGGGEVDYGSDLDVLFVASERVKNPALLHKFAVGVMDLLSRHTADGTVFNVDARLRPEGEKGLLVSTLDACENYYRRRAGLWEIQTLTRARLVAGDMKIGEGFQRLAARLTDFSSAGAPVPPDWKRQIHRMRIRIQKERTPPGLDHLAIKTGKGGLMDAEFIAQALCLEQGWHEPGTLKALERARDAGVLPDAKKLIASYERLRRVAGILRLWSYEGETVLPEDEAAYYRVAVRCGFASAQAFREALADLRRVIRNVYEKFFFV